MRTAAYLIIPFPSTPLDGDVVKRVWIRKDVSYGHLRLFGCRAFVHVPKDERSKLYDKAKKSIFLGYADEKLGYKLWDPVDNKVIKSKDVVFLKDQKIEDFEKVEKPQSIVDDLVVMDSVLFPIIHDDDGEMCRVMVRQLAMMFL